MKLKRRTLIEIAVILLSGVALFLFSTHDDFMYHQAIGEVVAVKDGKAVRQTDQYKNVDYQARQRLTVVQTNGRHRGRRIIIHNTFSRSGALDQDFHRGQHIFLTNIRRVHGTYYATASRFKRDTTLLMLAWLVVVLLYLVMHAHGLRTLLSVAINFILFLFFVQLDVTLNLTHFFWLFALSAVLFTGLTLCLVIGVNRQCLVTFLAIVTGTTLAFVIGIGTLQLTHNAGVHYEALGYATQAPQELFLSATVIGLLGAVMDAATDIVSTLFEMHRADPDVSRLQLFKSGQEVGRSILGPLINVLLLIFFAETIAIAVLYFRTGNPIGYTFQWTMELGIIQALISGIGIALVIPSASCLAAVVLGKKERSNGIN